MRLALYFRRVTVDGDKPESKSKADAPAKAAMGVAQIANAPLSNPDRDGTDQTPLLKHPVCEAITVSHSADEAKSA